MTEAGVLARQALADVRAMTTVYPGPDRPETPPGSRTGAAVAPRLALTVLVVELCGFAAQNLNNIVAERRGPAVTVTAAAAGLAIMALQLHHSRPSRGGGQPWAAWPWTLAVQALLFYGMIPVLGADGFTFAGFIAGSALLLVPGRYRWAAFGAVVASVPALLAVWPFPGVTPRQEAASVVYLTAVAAGIGLMVYGLSRLAALAVQLEALRGELARIAVQHERMRVARNTHDLLGLGLSAVALKADLIMRLRVSNDGAAGPVPGNGRSGSGLANLTARSRPPGAASPVSTRTAGSTSSPRSRCQCQHHEAGGGPAVVRPSPGSPGSARRGSMTCPPLATVRTTSMSSPAGPSLSRKPATFAASARWRLPRVPRPVRISARHPGRRLASSPAAARPSTPGRSMSRRATSGRCSRAAGTMRSPAGSAATTSMSASRDSSATSVSRTAPTSSAIRTLIMAQRRWDRPAVAIQPLSVCRPSPPVSPGAGDLGNVRREAPRCADRMAPVCVLHIWPGAA
jgi:hypothetical protein